MFSRVDRSVGESLKMKTITHYPSLYLEKVKVVEETFVLSFYVNHKGGSCEVGQFFGNKFEINLCLNLRRGVGHA